MRRSSEQGSACDVQLLRDPDTLNLKNATPDRRGLDPLPFLDILVTPVREPAGRIALQAGAGQDSCQQPA
jgi:hypothetical protein